MELPKEKKVPYSFFSLCPPTSCCHHSHFCPREAGTVLDLEYALGTGEGNRKARASRFYQREVTLEKDLERRGGFGDLT